MHTCIRAYMHTCIRAYMHTCVTYMRYIHALHTYIYILYMLYICMYTYNHWPFIVTVDMYITYIIMGERSMVPRHRALGVWSSLFGHGWIAFDAVKLWINQFWEMDVDKTKHQSCGSAHTLCFTHCHVVTAPFTTWFSMRKKTIADPVLFGAGCKKRSFLCVFTYWSLGFIDSYDP